MAVVTVFSDFGIHVNTICHFLVFSLICLPWSNEMDAMILVFLMLSFEPAFSLSSFHLHQEAP